jgi:hypothetical protein
MAYASVNGAADETGGAGPALPPLRVAGIVLAKRDLVAALRVYLPALRDVQCTEDGEHFWLWLGEPDLPPDALHGGTGSAGEPGVVALDAGGGGHEDDDPATQEAE